MVILASLVVPAAVAVWLLTGGRGVSHRTANFLASAASVLTLAGVLFAVITRPTVDRAWVPSLGLRWQLAVDGISAQLLLLTAIGVVWFMRKF